MAKIVVTCQQCGKKFYVYPYRKNAKFCSKECSYKGREKRPKILIKKICQQCGKEYKVWHGRYASKFCSFKCYWINMKKEKKAIVCKTCGKIFYVRPGRAKYNPQYC